MSRESLEEAMNAFLKEQNQETQAAMLKEFSAYSFFVPGVFPQGTDLSDLRAKLPGNKIRLPQDKRPFPAVIRNNEGEYFVPAYLAQNEVKGEPKPQVIMQMPFSVIAGLAAGNPNVAGIAINPFKQNILLRRTALQRLSQKPGFVKATDPVTAARRRMETEIFPKAFFADPAGFTAALEKEEGEYLLNLLPEQEKKLLSYQADQFSCMALNIKDDLTLIRLDLPKGKEKTVYARRAYLLFKEESKACAWYTVETGAGAERIMETKADGVRLDLGEAPTEGVEINRMMELFEGTEQQV